MSWGYGARFFLARAVIVQGSSPASTEAARIFPFPWPALGVDRLLLLFLAAARGARCGLSGLSMALYGSPVLGGVLGGQATRRDQRRRCLSSWVVYGLL
jgi:hypothetical protein